MSVSPSVPAAVKATSAITSTALVVVGVAFMLAWMAGVVALGMMAMMGGLMANDAGRASGDRHMGLLVFMAGGLVLLALAGVPGGLAFFWAGHRAQMLWLFGGLAVAGVAVPLVAMWWFFSAVK